MAKRSIVHFDGSSDRLTIGTPFVLGAGDYIKLQISFTFTSGTRTFIDSSSGNRPWVQFISGQLQYNTGVISSVTIDGSVIANLADVTSFQNDGILHEVIVNISATCGFSNIMSHQAASQNTQGYLSWVEVSDGGVITTWNLASESITTETNASGPANDLTYISITDADWKKFELNTTPDPDEWVFGATQLGIWNDWVPYSDPPEERILFDLYIDQSVNKVQYIDQTLPITNYIDQVSAHNIEL